MFLVETGRETKVGQFDVTASVQENIVGFDVTDAVSEAVWGYNIELTDE